MISGNPSVKFELISQMIAQENNQMTVTELCAIAHVSRSGYYRWVDAAPLREEREKADQADFELENPQAHGQVRIDVSDS